VRNVPAFLTACLIGGVLMAPAVPAHEGAQGERSDPQAKPAGLVSESLLRHELEGVEGTEVIISRIEIPPHTTLPKHWHPGEEFVYLLEGTATLWMDGKEETIGGAGAVAMVPLKEIHTAITGDEGVVAIVFRVHEKGQPERVLVE
jgi:quercetin dioxygenase-like cupin family protein